MNDSARSLVLVDEHGPAMPLRHGGRFHLLDPRAEDVRIEDIAASLSKLCRWTGHVRKFYSVAEHSVTVSEILPPRLQLAGLLHDAAETYIGDISRPMRIAVGSLDRVEAPIERVIAAKFGLAWPMPAEVREADNIVLATELRDLMPEGALVIDGLPSPLALRTACLSPFEAELAFLRRFHHLAGAV
jgi:uncharacterized protein